MSLLRELDPQGVSIRSRKKLKRRCYRSLGPNDCWHIDDYDKIKRFGFAIIRCIDGFSRKMLWLGIVNSNNDTFVTASAYLNFISELEAILRRIRTDCGTENCVLAAIQCYFRREHTDEFAGDEAHIYRSSHSNQRIEAWCSCLRGNWSSFIINFFTEMVESGEYNPDDKLEKECAKFCFTGVIKKELNRFNSEWNTHCFRKSEFSQVHGRPNELWFLENVLYENQKLEFSDEEYVEMKNYVEEYLDDNGDVYANNFDHLCNTLGYQSPMDLN